MSREELLKQLKEITDLLKDKENQGGGGGSDDNKSKDSKDKNKQENSKSDKGSNADDKKENGKDKDKDKGDKDDQSSKKDDAGDDKQQGKKEPKSEVDRLLDELENEINKKQGGNKDKNGTPTPDKNGDIEDPNGEPKEDPNGKDGGQGEDKEAGDGGNNGEINSQEDLDKAKKELENEEKGLSKKLEDLEKSAKKLQQSEFRGESIDISALDEMGANDLFVDAADLGKTETQIENDLRQLVASAISECEKAGKDPGGMKRYLDFIEQEFPIWELYLAPYFKQSIIPRYTYQTSYKNNITRATGGKIIQRGAQFEKKNLDHILFAIDVSGSIDEEKLTNFGSQVKAFLEKRKGKVSGITCFWDTAVRHSFEFNDKTSFVKEYLKAKEDGLVNAGGGTSPDCLFEFAKENKCKYVVVSTDGEFYSLNVEKWKQENFRCVIWSLWSKEDYKEFVKEGGNWPKDKNGQKWGKAST